MGALTCGPMEPDVTFLSDAFNTTESREYFINPECFGDDVTLWLIRELRSRGIDVDPETGQEDFGWYLRFRVDGVSHCLVLTLVPEDDEEPARWACWFERDAGLLSTLFGGRRRGVALGAIRVVRDILESSPEVRDMRWAAQFP
jgi:hypothetical protein